MVLWLGGQDKWSADANGLGKGEQGGFALLRVCPSSLCIPHPSHSLRAPGAQAVATDTTSRLLDPCCLWAPIQF